MAFVERSSSSSTCCLQKGSALGCITGVRGDGMKRLALVAVLASMVTACGVARTFPPPDPTANPSNFASEKTWSVDDQRPQAEKEQKTLSLWLFSCEYGVKRLSDDDVIPRNETRVQRLSEELTSEFGSSLNGHRVVLRHYTMYLNMNAEMVGSPLVGPLGKALVEAPLQGASAKAHQSCPKEKMGGGWFEQRELTSPHTPFITEITLEIDGRPLTVRRVYSPPTNAPPQLMLDHTPLSPDMIPSAEAAMLQAEAALMDAVRHSAALGPPSSLQ